MSRQEFLWELRAHLIGKMPQHELEQVMAYYTEYFEEAGPEGEQAVLEGLGGPQSVARQVLGDQAIRDLEQPPNGAPGVSGEGYPKRRGLSTVWTVILAIFAVPIGLPLALAAVIVIFVLMISVFAVIVSFGAAALGCIVGGVVAMIAGFSAIFSGVGTTLLFSGSGLAVLGAGLFLALGTAALWNVCFKGAARLLNRLFRKRGYEA